jgi:CRISPR-associated endonuclease/helicase Cas3
MLTSDSTAADDVADEWRDGQRARRRCRIWDNDDVPAGMRLVRTIDTRPEAENEEETESAGRRFWRWYELPTAGDSDGSKTNNKPVRWQVHVGDVLRNAERVLASLPLSDDLKKAVILAAKFHDHGKRRDLWQRSIGHRLPSNPKPDDWLAKSGTKMQSRGFRTDYRHEFGSLLDTLTEDEFKALNHQPDLQELILHVIAAHHGHGRPHFPADGAFDPEPKGRNVERMAAVVPGRFARLQRKYGRWGLAYLESLLRAADYAASATPSDFVEDRQ